MNERDRKKHTAPSRLDTCSLPRGPLNWVFFPAALLYHELLLRAFDRQSTFFTGTLVLVVLFALGAGLFWSFLLKGLLLGVMSSFLGIGGGPINLVVLYFFFSMDTKTAAANSLYIILFSQITSLVTTLVTGTVPEFQLISLVVMVAGGIGGGIVGRKINKKIDGAAVEKLFICLMAVIIAISIWNTYRYLVLGG